MMLDNEDYYRILGIDRSATFKDIKEAYLYWVNILHPDRMCNMPERIRIQAEEDLKKVNKANEVLSDAKKRAQYDMRVFGGVETVVVNNHGKTEVKGKPKLEIYPKTIFFDKAFPYVKQRGSFYIRNVGGYFSKVIISTPPRWLKILRTKSLYPNIIESITNIRKMTIKNFEGNKVFKILFFFVLSSFFIFIVK